ncbi:MAG: DUF6198 family protein, partial [Treponemataceae bacterium]|nr:DUF6198 family protein [Treponemataceae bacterium]
MRNKIELIKRYIFFFIGIVSNAIGVAFLTRSNLGAGPSTTIPYVISLLPLWNNFKFPVTYGLVNFVFTLFLLLLQIVILRKKFNHIQWLQIPVSFVFSFILDVAMKFTANINLSLYVYAILWTLLGCVLRAFGVACQVLADVVMLSPEALVKAVSDATRKSFGVWKIIIDASMTSIALVISFFCLHEIVGVREGTLISVLIVGPLAHYFTKKLGFATHYFENEGELIYETKLKLQEGKKLVITITSQS